MIWIAEWFNPDDKRVINALTLDEADEKAHKILGKYPHSLYPKEDAVRETDTSYPGSGRNGGDPYPGE